MERRTQHHQRPLQNIRDIQAIVESQDRLAGFQGECVNHTRELILAEQQELDHALIDPSSSREDIAGEIADNIILLAKLCNHMGLDLATIVTGKLYRNYDKYVVPNLHGVGQQEARAAWNKANDPSYLSGV